MGGEGVLGFVVTAFSHFWFGFGLVSCRGPCRSIGMGAVVGGCASRDICLDVPGFAVGLQCLLLGG